MFLYREQQVHEVTGGERGNGYSVLLDINGNELETTKDAVCDALGVESIIRISYAEYPNAASAGDVVTHFGLYIPPQIDMVGQRTVLAKIARGGFNDVEARTERFPLLQLENCWVGEIVTSVPEIAAIDICVAYFTGPTIGAIASYVDLQRAISQRYSKSTNMTITDILAQKISVRQVRLVGRVATLDIARLKLLQSK